MNTTQVDAVDDFDLDFLLSATNNIPALKQKCITQLKRRIVRVDAIQRHCMTLNQHLNNKSKELETTLKKLELTQQDYKQTSLEYKEVLESSAKCEKENQQLKDEIKKLQTEHLYAVTQLEAKQSHMVQLEQLIKQQERKIGYLENNDPKHIQKTIEEKVSAEIKEKDKEKLLWKKKYEALRKKVKDKESKRKLHKALLSKPDKNGNETTSDSLSHDEHSDNEDNISDKLSQLVSQELSKNTTLMNKRCPNILKDNIRVELDNDYTNEITSIDTGCGSSLASSDNEKWLNSPDYMFSPIHGDSIDNTRGQKLVTVGTSPITLKDTTNVATSPISVCMIEARTSPITSMRMIDVSTSPITQFKTVVSPKPVITIDRAVTPVKLLKSCSVSTSPLKQYSTREATTSPVNSLGHLNKITESLSTIKEHATDVFVNRSDIDMQETTTITKVTSSCNIAADFTDVDTQDSTSSIGEISLSPCKVTENVNINTQKSTIDEHKSGDVVITLDEIVNIDITQETQGKNHLNLNNSCKIDTDYNSDSEIEMILNNMRFNRKLITPLPRTPGRTICPSANTNYRDIIVEEKTHTVCQEAAIARDHATTAREEAAAAREYAAKTRQEHIKLMSDFTKLMKDMINIKSFLKTRLSMPDDLKLEEIDQLSTLNNNSRSVKMKKQSLKLVNNLKSDQLKDLSPIPTINDNSNQSQELLLRRDGNLRPSQSPMSKQLPESVNKSNLDILQSLQTDSEVNKVTIISEKLLKSSDLDNLKTKQDWKELIQKSDQVLEFKECRQQNVSKVEGVESLNNKIEKHQSPNHNTKKKRLKKPIATNLSKYRQKCQLRKYKIKRESPPLKKPRPLKQLKVCLKRTTSFDTSATLNDKNVYANAVKVMAQLKTNTNTGTPNPPVDMEMESDKQCVALNVSATANTTKTANEESASISKQPDAKDLTDTTSSTPTARTTIVTRSRKISDPDNISQQCVVNSLSETSVKTPENLSPTQKNSKKNQTLNDTTLEVTTRKRKLAECSEVTPKRVLRNTQRMSNDEENRKEFEETTQSLSLSDNSTSKRTLRNTQQINNEDNKNETVQSVVPTHPKESILCVMIHKYATNSIKYRCRNAEDVDARNVLETITTFMSETENVSCKQNMNKLVAELEKYNYKNFIDGLMLYLHNADRKLELYSKMSALPAQIQITKSEAVLMYVIKQLKITWRFAGLYEAVLSSIEYILFRLNRTPTFDIVEGMSHFYAVLCRLIDNRDRLITFMLDSMYCIHFKAVILIKQCLEAWPNIIPLAHMSKAKTPLMTCFVYLLHFFKCEDRFNRLQDLRNIMNRTYYYEITQWNEKKILELLKCSIRELKDNEQDKKMLRIALIVFGKRHGPKWTNVNIIKNLLKPFIDTEKVALYIKVFCISTIGPLMKPYPVDMKVHCNIALDQLTAILNSTKSKQVAEAAMTSILMMSRHNCNRVNEILFARKMETFSPELEELIRDYVRSRTLKVWLKTLPTIDCDPNKAMNNGTQVM